MRRVELKLSNAEAIKLLIALTAFFWSVATIPDIGLKGLLSFVAFVASTFYIVWFVENNPEKIFAKRK